MYRKRKFLLSCFLMPALIAAFLLTAGSGCNALAADNIEVIRIAAEKTAKYHFFDDPRSVASEGDLLAVSADNMITVFDTSDFSVTSSVTVTNTAETLFLRKDYAATLSAGSLTFFGVSEDKSINLPGSYECIYLSGNTLFVASGSRITGLDADKIFASPGDIADLSDYIVVIEKDMSPEILGSRSKSITAITAAGSRVFFSATAESNRNYDDIYLYDTAESSVKRVFSQGLRSVKLAEREGKILSLGNTGVQEYSYLGGMLLPLGDYDIPAYDFCTSENNTYFLTDKNGISYTSGDLSNISPVLVSQGSEEGYFSSPASSALRAGAVYTADTMNNRISVLAESNTFLGGFYRPAAVAVDNTGVIYVAHSINKIAKLNKSFEKTAEFDLGNFSAEMLQTDARNNLYVSGSGSILCKKAGSDVFESVSTIPSVKSFYINRGRAEMLFFDGASLYLASDLSDIMATTAKLIDETRLVSVSSDIAGNIICLLNDGHLLRIEAASSATKLFYSEQLVGAKNIALSYIQNDYTGYGDIIVTNPAKHALFKITDGLDMVVTDESFVPPDIKDPQPRPLSSDIFVHKISYDTQVFEKPIETVAADFLEAGARIFIADDTGTGEYVFIVYEASGSLRSGYVFKTAVRYLEYSFTPPPASKATVFSANTPIYKWPSFFSNIINYKAKNDTVDLLSFAAPYGDGYSAGCFFDNSGSKWYRVKFGDTTEGYIRADSVSINSYDPTVRPNYNASIKVTEETKLAFLYYVDESDGEYKLIPGEVPLPDGTRVEITKTPLDPAQKYTEIKLYKDGLGTLTCYVETEFIKYDTINAMQIVAIIGIIITVLLIASVIFFAVRARRKKRTL